MSDCLDENAALQLLDGTLPSASRTRVERHLEECDACRELVAELTQIVSGPEASDEPSADTERIPIASGAKLEVGDHVGPYRAEHAIGAGAAGTVYRAVDTRTNQVVALKLLTDAALRSRFAREAETLSRLDHPGIVKYIAHGEMPGGLYLAMEWLEGEDLAHRLERGPLDWQSARALGMSIAAALGHAHGLGCVHRDLSPKNVFLPNGRFDRAKLLDFGLVRVPDPGLDRTTSQAVLGTPFYMAPEQVRDPKSVDARADLFGLGVLLFEAVSGRRPFEADDLFTVWIRIVDQPTPNLRTLRVPSLPPVPEAFICVIEHLLAKDPNVRPRSAADVADALATVDTVTAAMPVLAMSTAPMKRPPEFMREHPAHPSQPELAATQLAPPLPPNALPSTGSHRVIVTAPVQVEAVNTPSSQPRSGVILMTSIGIGALIALGLAIGGVYTKAAERATDAIDNAKQKPSIAEPSPPVATDVNGTRVTDDDSDDRDRKKTNDGSSSRPVFITPVPEAGSTAGAKAKPEGGRAPIEQLACGQDDVQTLQHGHYAPHNPSATAITAGSTCKLTLEDCLIDGPRSLNILGDAVVTLRRCAVKGDAFLVGGGTLHLYDTVLPNPPSVTGKGRLVRH